MFKKVFLSFLLVTSFTFAEYPSKPLKFIVYTAPGGIVDLTMRKLAQIIEKQNDLQVIVENKKGGGGVLALNHVVSERADGYNILGVTNSFVSKTLSLGKKDKLQNLDFFKLLVEDYECLIVNKDSGIKQLSDLSSLNKKLIFTGPAKGGTDYLFAKKVWKILKLNAVWLPYSSGSQAIAAVLGKHADVYVGNPQDILGRNSLKILAIASPNKLDKFPATTFLEVGYKELSKETLWRGLAIKKDTPEPIKKKITTFINQALRDPLWNKFIVSSNVLPIKEDKKRLKEIILSLN